MTTSSARAAHLLAMRMIHFVREARQHPDRETAARYAEAFAYGIATGLAEAVAMLLLPDESPPHPSYTAALLQWAHENESTTVSLSPAQMRALRRVLSDAVHDYRRVRYL
jgi:hypothetical protein